MLRPAHSRAIGTVVGMAWGGGVSFMYNAQIDGQAVGYYKVT